uniref:Uncharacterized protein n=1 Tax=Rhizophora mucronata TaxID=61149 RepID=A0A2P2J2E4_RHIMU
MTYNSKNFISYTLGPSN